MNSIVFAQTATTTTDTYVSPYTILENPYADLSPEEQAKLPTSAQVPAIIEQVSVDVSPEVPKPGQTVTFNITSYGGIDIDRAQVNWVVNGKSILKGFGEKQFIFTPSEDGKLTTVVLHIQPQYGAEVTKTFKFQPSEVDVLWQASTYTPPFYKGKALFTPEADVQFVAMPNIQNSKGVKIQPGKAVYDWEINYKHYADKSGYGKNYYNYAGSILAKPVNIRVSASDPLNTESAGVGSLDITPTQPILLMYEIHPTYGPLFNRAAVGTFNFGVQDIQLGAYPYFYSVSSKKSLSYVWKINGVALDALPQNQDFVVLQKVKPESGQSTVSVVASNGDKVLQQSMTSLDLLY